MLSCKIKVRCEYKYDRLYIYYHIFLVSFRLERFALCCIFRIIRMVRPIAKNYCIKQCISVLFMV